MWSDGSCEGIGNHKKWFTALDPAGGLASVVEKEFSLVHMNSTSFPSVSLIG